MKFAIISDIHLGEEKEHKGVIRKMSRYSKQFLAEFIEKMNSDTRPTFVVNLGDAINDVSHDVDVQNLRFVLNSLKKLSCPVFNLVGNHEQWTMERGELENELDLKSLHYSTDSGDYHLIILFSEAFKGTDSKIGEEQKEWLREDLARTNKKTLVFVHHSLADQDLTGNFWFEAKPNRALVGNREEIRNIFEDSGKIIAVFNGHVHWNHMDIHGGIPYFNITSIVENFKNDGTPAGSFAIVEINDQSIQVNILGADSAQYHHDFAPAK